MKARYEAAEASTRVSEAMTGVGDEMADVTRSIERAEERTDEMEARSQAMDELVDTGAFDDALSDKDSIDRELESGRTNAEVDSELETLKSEMGGSADKSGASGSDSSSETDPEPTVDVSDAEVEAELEELKDDEE
jgi:phage shock protein A